MDKSLAKYFACYKGLDLSDEGRNFPVDPKPEMVESSLKSVLDEIFSVDPKSGLPKGDIQYYMSSDGNPQVKQWIENNLLKPRVSSGTSTPEGVTDDMIVEMSRKKGESVSDYQARLINIYDSAMAEVEKLNNPNP